MSDDRIAALVSALGYDDTHRGEVHKGYFKGLRIYDATGQCVKFYSVKQLLAMEEDMNVVQGFADAHPPEKVESEP